MSDWLTARELAGLPGLGGSARAVQLMAARNRWPRRRRNGRGGPVEYAVDALPAAAREELRRRRDAATAARRGVGSAGHANPELTRLEVKEALATAADERARQAGLAAFAALDETRQARAEARAALVRRCRDVLAAEGLPFWRGLQDLAARYNAGALAVEPWVRDRVPRVAASSLRNWSKTLERAGLAALAGRHGRHRKGRGRIEADPELRDAVLGMIVDHPHASAKHVMRLLRARFAAERLPAYRTVQRYLQGWKAANRQLHAAVVNPDKWRSHYRAAGGDAAAGVVRLNQVWEMDSTPGDVLLADGKRHAVIGVIDVYSRRLKLHVARTSNSRAIASLLRRALIAWGVPETLRTDNGQDYVSRHIDRVLDGLGVARDLCPPFAPDRKPFIERALGSFAHDLVELLDGFIGHDVAQRKDIEARKSFAERLTKRDRQPLSLGMDPEAFQAFCDQWCETLYAQEPHRGLGGDTPFARAAAWRPPTPAIADERALDVLLAEAPGEGWRTVGKKGLRVDGATFDHPALGGREGARVRVRFDEAEAGRLYVFDDEGGYLCTAIAPDALGVSRAELASARRKHQAKAIAEAKRELKATARRAGTGDVVTEILAERARAAGKLAAFPGPHRDHETPALEEAAAAARDDEIPTTAAALTPEAQAAADAAWARLTAAEADNVVPLPGQGPGLAGPAGPTPSQPGPGARPTFEDSVALARWIIDNPDAADPDDRAWLGRKLASANFRLMLGLDNDEAEDSDVKGNLAR